MKTNNQTKVTAEPGKQELFITRQFEAPRELVFKAFTDPGIVSQFLGPRDMVMTIDHYNMKTGGSYRYIHTDPAGNEYAFNGAVHEVTFPERMIQTFEFEGLPERGHVSLDTALFEPLPGNRTQLTMHSVFRSVADRDGIVAAGMERGIREGFERLDEFFVKNS
ncbi:SRPBCC family protein [Chitinophaga sp. GCM10012297]|uniref:SRPBCC family protein n=1 Tax=Chitinophaga chungangae TaxID=2821488 RepID=A0ABS3YHP1_9BACT|nr:SRPBCC family protein [Chitinophaga chungangae]MBO9153803.1 SRPBCC family protein [Chitinophaga chungangae]